MNRFLLHCLIDQHHFKILNKPEQNLFSSLAGGKFATLAPVKEPGIDDCLKGTCVLLYTRYFARKTCRYLYIQSCLRHPIPKATLDVNARLNHSSICFFRVCDGSILEKLSKRVGVFWEGNLLDWGFLISSKGYSRRNNTSATNFDCEAALPSVTQLIINQK